MVAAGMGLLFTLGVFSPADLTSAAKAEGQVGCTEADKKTRKVVFLAGRPSEEAGVHEYAAGCRLLAKALNENVSGVHAVLHEGRWPKDPSVLEGVAAIVVYSDGNSGSPIEKHWEELDELMKKGVGLACLHHALEARKGRGQERLLDWIGGYYDQHRSVSPHWTPNPEKLPEHPVCRGVKALKIADEWCFHLQFREKLEGITAILVAPPPSPGRKLPGGHSHVTRAAQLKSQVLAWVRERPGGGRSFGFTGGHKLTNWADDNYRKFVLNAIVWLTGAEVPEGGVRPRGLDTPNTKRVKAQRPREQTR